MRPLLALAALVLFGSTAAAQHQHGKPGSTPEAFTATPAFAPDGTLWVVRPNVDRIVVQRSTDLGKTFAAPVTVTPDPMNLDWGPDARARIVVDPKGQLVVTFGTFQDKNFNGRAYFARSSDGGASFTQAAADHGRHDQPALRGRGRRSRRAASSRPGSTSATSPRRAPPAKPIPVRLWPMPGRTATRISATPPSPSTTPANAAGLALAFAGAGRPAVVFRNIFPGSVRDHGVITFRDPDDAGTGAPRQRRRLEDRGLPAPRPQPGHRARRLRTTSPGSPTAPRARACSMPAPILADAPYSPAARRCRRPTASRRGRHLLGQRPGAAPRVEGVRRRQGGGALAGHATTAVDNGAHPAPWPRRRTPPIIPCWSPTSSAPTCRG